jgi:hypothetical protein
MAQDSMMANLFGVSPEIYQQNQQEIARKQGIEFAQLDPYERVNAMAYTQGRGLGSAIGGLLGVQDPAMKLMSQRAEIGKQYDLTKPEGFALMSKELFARNDPQGAAIALQRAKELQESLAKTDLEAAQAGKARAESGEIASKRDSLTSRIQALTDSGMSEALAKGIASNDKAFADTIAAKNIATPAEYAVQARALGFEVKPYLKDYTSQQIQSMEKGVFAHKAGIAKAGATSMIIPVDQMFNKAFTAQDAEKQANSWNAAGEAFATIPSTRQKLADVRGLIDNSFTGTGANVKLGASKLARALNLPVDINKASNTEITEALTTQFAITELKKNFGSNPAVKDFEYQLKVKPGILQEPETFKRLVSNLEKGLVAEEVAYKRGEQYKQNNKGSIYGFNPYSAKAEATTQVNRYYELMNLADKAKTGKGTPLTSAQIQEAQTLQKELGGNL